MWIVSGGSRRDWDGLYLFFLPDSKSQRTHIKTGRQKNMQKTMRSVIDNHTGAWWLYDTSIITGSDRFNFQINLMLQMSMKVFSHPCHLDLGVFRRKQLDFLFCLKTFRLSSERLFQFLGSVWETPVFNKE